MRAGELVGRYALERQVGEASTDEGAEAWEARAADGSEEGAFYLEILDIAKAADWDGYERFRRRIEALKSAHPGRGALRFVESFEDSREGDARLVLAARRAPPPAEGQLGAAPEPSPGEEPAPITLPSDSKVRIAEYDGRLEISLPAAGLANLRSLAVGGFSLFWLAFVAFWTFSAAAMGAPILFVLFSLPFWAVGLGLLRSTLASTLKRAELSFDEDEGLVVVERLLGARRRAWPVEDLGDCSVRDGALARPGIGGTQAGKELSIEAGTRCLRLGAGLSERELRAVADRIRAWRRATGSHISA